MTTSEHCLLQRTNTSPFRHSGSRSKFGSTTLSPSGKHLGRRYFQEILDRKTGELVSVDKGDWITLSELAELFSHGPRRTTTVLRHLGFLQIEGGGRNDRHRICDWVVERGWGKRCHRKADKFPFDVVGPEAVHWISDRWADALGQIEREASGPLAEARQALDEFQAKRISGQLCVEMQCRWLADHYAAFTNDQIAKCIDVSRQLIDRYTERRSSQIKYVKALKEMYRSVSRSPLSRYPIRDLYGRTQHLEK